jgi:hypothetical protein
MEWSDWSDVDLVQLIVCEECGYAGCENGGYARVSRLGGHVLLTPPLVDPTDAWAMSAYQPSHAIREHGGVALALSAWAGWQRRFRNLPAPAALPATKRTDLRAAWELEHNLFRNFWDEGADPVLLLRDRLIAAESESTEEAQVHLLALIDWFAADEELPLGSELVHVDERGAKLETVYFDVPDTFGRRRLREWRAFARTDGYLSPAFGNAWLLVPEPLAA